MKQQTLQEAWDDYTRHSRSMGIKDSTLTSRKWATKDFLRDYGHKRLTLVNDQHVAAFFLLAAERRSARTMNTTHAILAAFYKYCVGTGRLKPQQNPMFARRAPKFEKRDMVRIPVMQWPQLFTLAEASDPRDRAVIALGLYTLLRDQEMAQLRLRDVQLGDGRIRATIPKTNDTDLVAIPNDLDYELRRWYQHYQHIAGPLDPDMYLLPAARRAAIRNDEGKWERTWGVTRYEPFTQIEKCSRIVTPLFKELGYQTRDPATGRSTGMGAHTLRRSGARAYYDHFVQQGRADALRVVQTMLHHKTAEMTQQYIGLREDRQTRDQLVRGVTIFGLHELPQIGTHNAPQTDEIRGTGDNSRALGVASNGGT